MDEIMGLKWAIFEKEFEKLIAHLEKLEDFISASKVDVVKNRREIDAAIREAQDDVLEKGLRIQEERLVVIRNSIISEVKKIIDLITDLKNRLTVLERVSRELTVKVASIAAVAAVLSTLLLEYFVRG